MKHIVLSLLLVVSCTCMHGSTLPIARIQGADHYSPFEGETVTTEGIVTRVYRNGFIIESKTPDADPATSEAIYIYQNDTTVSVGNELQVTGKVEEYTPGGGDSYNLSLTQVRLEKYRRLNNQASLPKPAVLNYLLAGFPKAIKQAGSGFDPSLNALDFWESMEHMRVMIMDASVIGPKSKFGEILLRVPQGRAETTTPKGGIKLGGYDTNAARIFAILDRDNEHNYQTGDRIPGTIHGNLTYSFGNYKVGVSKPLPAPVGAETLTKVQKPTTSASAVKMATFNVENLYTGLPDQKFAQTAKIIVDSLQSPQVIALQEIHDNSGPKNDETVDASLVLKKLTAFIQAAGGPAYQYLQLNPENNADGGWPGANIRNAFLYTEDMILGKSYRLEDPAFDELDEREFTGTRKPLVAYFTHGNEKLILINCHLKSKGGDTSEYGALRPAIRFSETQRISQARALRKHVDTLRQDHPEAGVMVLGDLNDYEFSPTLDVLTQNGGLTNLIDSVPLAQRYTYIFQGYSQVLDHILASTNLARRLSVDIAHVNSDFSEGLRASDHDPVLVWFEPH